MQSKKLRSIIVDDSAVQRLAVSKLISNHPGLELIIQYKDGFEAQKKVNAKDIDLIFLDVEMPILDGFEFIESMENPPQVILITGKPEYALKAFDYNVTDYLLKPITKDRFDGAIKKALARAGENLETKVEDQDHIFVNSSLKKVKVVIDEIKWIEGLGDYVKVVTENTNILVLSTMKAFIKKLPENQFLRIHKSYIVNLNKVQQFSSALVEVGGKQIPLSRHKKDELEEALTNSQN
jgi:DNA-binding LytR/AlgR family response regulator